MKLDVEVDIDIEEIYDSMNDSDIQEMSNLLQLDKDIKYENLSEELIKDFVYNLKFTDREMFEFLKDEVKYYEKR